MIKYAKYIAIVILLAGIGVFIYFNFLLVNDKKPPAPNEGVSGKLQIPGTLVPEPKDIISADDEDQELAGAPEPKLLRLTDFPVVSPSLNQKEDRVIFYKKDGGDLLSYSFDGKEQNKIANITIVGVLESLWSPQRNRAAVFYLDGETMKGFLHIGTSNPVRDKTPSASAASLTRVSNGASVAVLPQNITGFSWSPDGSSLLYLTENAEGSQLIIADSAGRNQRIAFETPLKELRPQWTASDIIALSTAPSGLAEGYLFRFSRNAGVLTRIARGFGLSALFAPDGSKTIISSTDSSGSGPRIVIRNSSGEEIWTPGLRTLAEKCAWHSKDVAYCAVPRVIPQDNVWPDEYLQGALHTADNIYKLDVTKKEISEVFAEGGFDITNLVISKEEDYLFFVNRRDGTLWRYRIKN